MPAAFRLYVPVYSATLLLSAFLLFGVQPLFGKMVLPLLGGAPSVWNTAMLFFQAMLLAGYAYAHATSHVLKPRTQAAVHIVLLLLFTMALPLAIPEGWEVPPATSNPAFWQIAMMGIAVGGPFFVLAATAPMLQRWFAATGHPDADNPYFLYAASNLGSMTALLLYPLVFEPLMTVQGQAGVWGGGYAVLIALIAACALMTGKRDAGQAAGVPADRPANDNPLTIRLAATWLLLSFVPSSLMLGVTTVVTTDLASAPLLWILPLALYVGTFIIAFARARILKSGDVMFLQGMALAMLVALGGVPGSQSHLLMIPLHLVLFFLTALACHMQLAQLRPGVRHLTAFYLVMSAGGVLGGVFNALVAPKIFPMPLEYKIVLGLSVFLRYMTVPSQSWKAAMKRGDALFRDSRYGTILLCLAAPLCAVAAKAAPMFVPVPASCALVPAYVIFAALLLMFWRRWAFALTAVAVMVMIYPGPRAQKNDTEKTILVNRNFFGIQRIVNTPDTRVLAHGTTLHGVQATDPEHSLIPLSYYHENTPAGDVFRVLDGRPGAQRIAALGLGIGSVACHSHPGRTFDFYEIDPDVARLAEDRAYFTYLSDCGSPYTITIGDARLRIAQAPDATYDLVFLDVFSSDNIPVHVMTKEAFEIYRRKLKPGGLIAINISNRYLDLRPEIAAIARDLGMGVQFKVTMPGKVEGTNLSYAGTHYALMADDAGAMAPFTGVGGWQADDVPPGKRAWTDSYSNIIGALQVSLPELPHLRSRTRKAAETE